MIWRSVCRLWSAPRGRSSYTPIPRPGSPPARGPPPPPAPKMWPDEWAPPRAIVGCPTAAVLHDTHPYSMPPDAIGIPGTLFLYRDRVRIVAGRFEAIHHRIFEPHAKSTLPEHRAQAGAAGCGQ